MFRKIQEARENEEGFTLIELLVVVIIIGILAAIAIPTFLNQRESARLSAVESDLRNAGSAFESHYVQHGAYPTSIDATTGVATDGTNTTELQISDGVTLTVSSEAEPATFCLTGDHAEVTAGTADGTYDSDGGGVSMDGDTCASTYTP